MIFDLNKVSWNIKTGCWVVLKLEELIFKNLVKTYIIFGCFYACFNAISVQVDIIRGYNYNFNLITY